MAYLGLFYVYPVLGKGLEDFQAHVGSPGRTFGQEQTGPTTKALDFKLF